jgi:hypothetical protein
MASYHLRIATDNLGTGAWSFEVNPLDFGEAFPERAYNRLPTISGSPLKQFPQFDTRIRRLKFDIIPGTNTTHRDFLLGTDEDDTTSLLYLKKLDSDGQLTIYWLNIPDAYQRLRPYGYRDTEWIPIRVLDVLTQPIERPGTPHWSSEMIFEIVPLSETDASFVLGSSALGAENPTVTSALDGCFTYDLNLAAYSDETADSFAGGAAFPGFVVVVGDLVYFGCSTPFYGLYIEMDTLETVEPDTNQGATAHAWHFWNGTAYTATTGSVTDNTDGFTKSEETITWTGAQTGWTAADLADTAASATSTDSLYWFRLEIGTVTTAWSFDKVWRN